jgi:hypothetical protein
MRMMWVLAAVLLTGPCFGQRCDSANAAYSGGWKPASSAPRNGTTVEMMETYGIAPWYGQFKWSMDASAVEDGKVVHYKTATPSWVSVDNPGHGVSDDACLFWRPTKTPAKYVDPTKGAQQSVAYWCAAMKRPYDKKTDSCK